MTDIKQAFRDQHELLSGRRVDTIFDLGAHTGETTAIYREVFPQAVIYGFEPFPAVLNQYSMRFAQDNLVKPIQLALSDESGTHHFYVNRNSVTNSCLPAAKDAIYWTEPPSEIANVSTIEVPAMTIDDFCQREGVKEVQILKMDIQGGELLALNGATQNLSRGTFSLIYTELLFVCQYEEQAFFYQIADFLSRFGYQMFDIYNQAYSKNGNLKWADALFVSPQIRSSLMQGRSYPGGHKKIEREYELGSARQQIEELQRDNDALQRQLVKIQVDVDWLLESIKAQEKQSAELNSAKRELENILGQIQNSASWRVLIRWRQFRDAIAPEKSWHRKLYDSMLRRAGS